MTPVSSISPLCYAPRDDRVTDIDGNMAGGVEVTIAFTNKEIRDLVVSGGLRHGWRPSTGFFPRGATPQMHGLPLGAGVVASGAARREMVEEGKPCFDGKCVQFEIRISHTSLLLSAVDIPTASQPTHKYCFLRYLFFDKSEFRL